MKITVFHMIGFILTLLGMVFIGFISGKFVKSGKDFASGGSKASTPLVVGTLVGTLVGGASTVGTAQLAFLNGLSSLWFTLGCSLGALIMALFFTRPFRDSGSNTIQAMISSEFGEKAGKYAALFGAIGIVINVISQILAASTLLISMFQMNAIFSSIVSILLMISYVIFGGVMGTGISGISKTFLLYGSVFFSALSIIMTAGRVDSIMQLPKEQFFNFFSRGIGIDMGALVSLIVGVLSTQTYLQAILSAKDYKTAKKGAIISAVLVPPIGFGSLLVGLHMRAAYPMMNPALAFPRFIIENFSPFFAGVALASLLITIIGTGAGLALGGSVVVTGSFFKDKALSLSINRIVLLIILGFSCVLTFFNIGDIILEWSFLSLALRGAVTFFPMCMALFFPGRVHSYFIIAGIILNPIIITAANFLLRMPFDPLFIGLGLNVLLIVAGYYYQKRCGFSSRDGR